MTGNAQAHVECRAILLSQSASHVSVHKTLGPDSQGICRTKRHTLTAHTGGSVCPLPIFGIIPSDNDP